MFLEGPLKCLHTSAQSGERNFTTEASVLGAVEATHRHPCRLTAVNFKAPKSVHCICPKQASLCVQKKPSTHLDLLGQQVERIGCPIDELGRVREVILERGEELEQEDHGEGATAGGGGVGEDRQEDSVVGAGGALWREGGGGEGERRKWEKGLCG